MSSSIPMTSISIIYQSAESVLHSATSVLATETAAVGTRSLADVVQNAQATMSYYSYLGLLATETNQASITSIQSEAAIASSIMHELWADGTFFRGNAPSFGGNLALLILMASFLTFHTMFGLYYGQWWFTICFTLGLSAETIGYAGRIISSHDVESSNGFIMQVICIGLAPSMLMAGLYYTLPQLTIIMGEQYSRLKPGQYIQFFITCGVISTVLQAVGGASAASAAFDYSSTKSGTHIMVGGIAFQLFTMTTFQFFWYDFIYHCYKGYKLNKNPNFSDKFEFIRSRKLFKWYFLAISLAALLIYIRCIYRLVELNEGFKGTLAVVETYFFIFESALVGLSVLLMTICHPGFAYGRNPGIETDVTSHLFIFNKIRKLRNYKTGWQRF